VGRLPFGHYFTCSSSFNTSRHEYVNEEEIRLSEQSQCLHILNYVRVIIIHVMPWLEDIIVVMSAMPAVVRGWVYMHIILPTKQFIKFILYDTIILWIWFITNVFWSLRSIQSDSPITIIPNITLMKVNEGI